MLYEFKLGHKHSRRNPKYFYVKDEDTVDYNMGKFHLGYKNLNDQARSDRPKTVESEAVL